MLPYPMDVINLHGTAGEGMPADDDNNYSEVTRLINVERESCK